MAVTDYGSEGTDLTVTIEGTATATNDSDGVVGDFMQITKAAGSGSEGAYAEESDVSLFGIDLTSDWTWVGMRKCTDMGTASEVTIQDIYESNSSTEELRLIRIEREEGTAVLRLQYNSATGLETWELAEPAEYSVDYDAWHTLAITMDADGGVGSDPLFTMYAFLSDGPVLSVEYDTSNGGPLAIPGVTTPDTTHIRAGAWNADTNIDVGVCNDVWYQTLLTEESIQSIAHEFMNWFEVPEPSYPQVLDVSTQNQTASFGVDLDYPATVNEGDGLLLLGSIRGGALTGFDPDNNPSDWIIVQDLVTSGGLQHFAWFRVADGSEGGTTFDADLTGTDPDRIDIHIYRLEEGTFYPLTDSVPVNTPFDYDSVVYGVEVGTEVGGTGGSTVTIGDVTTSWGTERNLGIAMGSASSRNISDVNTDYGNAAGIGTPMASARGEEYATTLFPADQAFTKSGGGGDQLATVYAVRPTATYTEWTDWFALLDWHHHQGDLDIDDLVVLLDSNGSALIDASGNGNAPGFLPGDLVVDEEPLGWGADYSASLDAAGADFVSLSGLMNLSTQTQWTQCMIGERRGVAFGQVLWNIGDDSNYVRLERNTAPEFHVRATDGSNVDTFSFETGPGKHRFGVTIRRDGDDLDIWIDGTKVSTLDLTGFSFSSITDMWWMGNASSSETWEGRAQHRGLWDVDLSDTLCAAFSDSQYGRYTL